MIASDAMQDRLPACTCHLPRRGFLKGLAAASLASAPYFAAEALAQGAGRRIDVHHHILPPRFAETAKANNLLPPVVASLTTQRSIEEMDRSGVATSILSIPSPGVWYGDVELARKLARDCNEVAARAAADHKGRFGSFATLPLPDVEGSIKEAAYALDTLQADGVHMWTSYGDKWLGHPSFTPLLEELNRRKAVVYTHPTTAACCGALVPEAPVAMIEYGTDTTRTIASLVFSGATNRFPDIRWIFSHAGGTMPFLVERFLFQADVQSRNPEGAKKIPNGVLAELKRLHFDTAQSSNPYALSSLTRLVSMSQILFGTDFPYRTTAEHVKGLADCGLFTATDLDAIGRGNAARLLPRYS
jgi:predicted TIM-barrel fold metal-dependent hydrolase